MQKAIFCMNACEQKSSKKLKNAKLQVNHQCHQCIKRVDIVDENIHFLEQKPLVTWKTSSPQWLPWKPLRELWQLAFKTSKKSKVTWWHSTCCGKLWRAKTFQRSSDQTAVSCYGFSLGFAEHAVALSNLHRGLLQAALRTQRWSLGGFAEPAIRAPLSCSCCRDGWLQSAAVGVKIEHVSKKSQEMIYIYILIWYALNFPDHVSSIPATLANVTPCHLPPSSILLYHRHHDHHDHHHHHHHHQDGPRLSPSSWLFSQKPHSLHLLFEISCLWTFPTFIFFHHMLTTWFWQFLAFAFLFPNCSRQRALGRTGRLRQVSVFLISHKKSLQIADIKFLDSMGPHVNSIPASFLLWSVSTTQSSSISGAFRELFEWNKFVFPDGLSTGRDLFAALGLWSMSFFGHFPDLFCCPTALAVRVRMGSSGNPHENSEMIQWYAPPIFCWIFLLILVISCNQIIR